MNGKRSSGLDFSDRNSALDQHPDVPNPYGTGDVPSLLARNKTERRRLQGLQRTATNNSSSSTPYVPTTFKEKLDVWMINEGGRRLFFGTWILLQILVVIFGFFNYQFKDDLTTARATFGITYRKQFS
jgi:NADPH oxidase 2